MTHPLTPREKVEKIIKEKVSGPHLTDPSHFVAMEQDRFSAADAILTALASGSGDHAELARLAEAATPGQWELDGQQCLSAPDGTIVVDYSCCSRGEWEANAAYLRAVQPHRVLGLLAENAALRAKSGLADMLGEKLERRTAALDEAERKLAEAVGLLSRIAFTPEGQSGLSLDECVSAARTFLSKEAERG